MDRLGPLLARELGDGGGGERLGLDDGGRGVQGDPVQQLVLLVAARGEDQRQREIVDAVDHVGQPAQRGLVEPVRVVDHDRERAEPGGQPVEAVQDGVVGLAADREGARGVGGGAGVGNLDAGEELLDAAEGEAALELRAACPQHPLVRRLLQERGLADPRRPGDQHAAARAVEHRRDRGALLVAFEQSQGKSPGVGRCILDRVSTYTVVVALHIIAVVAAYGLPLSAPLLVPYVRRHHPAALPGLHAAQYRLNNVVTGPFTVLVLAFGIYLASDGHRWDDPFVGDRDRGDRDHRRRGRWGGRPGAAAADGAGARLA